MIMYWIETADGDWVNLEKCEAIHIDRIKEALLDTDTGKYAEAYMVRLVGEKEEYIMHASKDRADCVEYIKALMDLMDFDNT
jgi:hypothetical protein